MTTLTLQNCHIFQFGEAKCELNAVLNKTLGCQQILNPN